MRYLFAICVLGGFLSSCETVIDLDVPRHPPKLVLNGFFYPDSALKVHLSESLFILEDKKFNSISNANIEVFEDDMSLGKMKADEEGWYSLDTAAKPQKHYTVVARSPNHQTIEATAYLPSKVEIIDVKISGNLVERDYRTLREIEVIFKDPGKERNYYEISFVRNVKQERYREDTLYTSYKYMDAVYIEFANPALEEGNNYGSRLIFDDLTFNGKEFSLKILVDDFVFERSLYFEYETDVEVVKEHSEMFAMLNHVEESYYLTQRSLDLQSENRDNPFAEPVIIFNEVQNGFGFFAGMHFDVFNIDVESAGIE